MDFELFEENKQEKKDFEMPKELPKVGDDRYIQRDDTGVTGVFGVSDSVSIVRMETGQIVVKSKRLNDEKVFDDLNAQEIGSLAVNYLTKLTKEEKMNILREVFSSYKPRNVMENDFLQELIEKTTDSIKKGDL